MEKKEFVFCARFKQSIKNESSVLNFLVSTKKMKK